MESPLYLRSVNTSLFGLTLQFSREATVKEVSIFVQNQCRDILCTPSGENASPVPIFDYLTCTVDSEVVTDGGVTIDRSIALPNKHQARSLEFGMVWEIFDCDSDTAGTIISLTSKSRNYSSEKWNIIIYYMHGSDLIPASFLMGLRRQIFDVLSKAITE